ncbi:hypothetical protein FEM08_33010 [Flavobacterium gilvum]|nr:hypothetical protein FEM08_33010 [Flavobacterium gilvum]
MLKRPNIKITGNCYLFNKFFIKFVLPKLIKPNPYKNERPN